MWGKILKTVKKIFRALYALLFSKKDENMSDKPKENKPGVKEKWGNKIPLLSPIRHRRYISIYCIADMHEGDVPVRTASGDVIAYITRYSKDRLMMEGTGRLPDGRVINIATKVKGEWRFSVMGPESPDGVGIRGKALTPWFSLAHELTQLKLHNLFERRVIIPSMRQYVLPDGAKHNGIFEVHDTGGGLRPCPYREGLWRTGEHRSDYGQFDLFIGGPESLYKRLLKTWDSYMDVFVMPRDLDSVAGTQEAINLLMDAGLVVDGLKGPNTDKAIRRIRKRAGLDRSSEWDEDIKEFVRRSLDNW